MILLFTIILINVSNINAFCEAFWLSNISSSYSSSPNLSEPVNTISSLTYSIFGLIGLYLNHFSEIYYLLMSFIIILGLSSFFHHYYYWNSDWAYASDIISMKLTASMTLYYITTNHNYFKYKIINKFIGLINLSLATYLLVSYKINHDSKPFIRLTIYLIISTQALNCIYFFYQKKKFKWLILCSSLWNACLVTLGYLMWIIDQDCPEWMHTIRFNGHAIWHITFAWALFNTINITNVSRYSLTNQKIVWKSLIPKIPWCLFIVILPDNKINIRDNSTSIELSEFRLLIDDSSKNHKRIRTFG